MSNEIHKVVIFGCNDTGAQIAQRVKENAPTVVVECFDRELSRVESLTENVEIESPSLFYKESLRDAGLVIFATDFDGFNLFLDQIDFSIVNRKCIFTDTCSVKVEVHNEYGSRIEEKGFPFIGGHLVQRTAFVTADALRTEIAATVARFWVNIGGCSKAYVMTPNAHDKIATVASHIPHILAATVSRLVGLLGLSNAVEARPDDLKEALPKDPAETADLILHNDAFLSSLQMVIADLEDLNDMVTTNDREGIINFLTDAK